MLLFKSEKMCSVNVVCVVGGVVCAAFVQIAVRAMGRLYDFASLTEWKSSGTESGLEECAYM